MKIDLRNWVEKVILELYSLVFNVLSMTEKELIELLAKYKNTESEIIEFKEWKRKIPFYEWNKNDKPKKCVYWYCVGIWNEWGWKLFIWVKDDWSIVWTKWNLPENHKQWIFEKTEQKIIIEEVELSQWKWKVIYIDIPSRQSAQLLKFNWVALMRVWDSLIEMNNSEIKKILNETKLDWSSLPCKWTSINDLDEDALLFLKNKKADITKDESYRTIDTKLLLNQLSLLTEKWIPNNTCILFVWKQEIAERKLPAISRFLWLYIDEKNNFEDRLNANQQRSPLILTISVIIEKIKKYNFPLEDITLFRQDTEYQYSEKAIEELLANSLAHRDWEINLANEVRQTPESLIFSNPWTFTNNLENVIEFSQITPYKNQTMADFLSKINLMENERRWLQKVFKEQLSKWVFVSKKEIDNWSWGIVQFILDWKIKDKNFAKLVLERKGISKLNLFLLQKIAEWKNIIGKDITEIQVKELIKNSYIELHWRTPNRKCRIWFELLEEIQQSEKYILDKWIWTKKKEKLILEYIEKKWQISTKEVYKLFSEANKNSLRVMLTRMVKEWQIHRLSKWKYTCNN